MKKFGWKLLSTAAGALTAILARKVTAAIWPGSEEPPLNPADRRVAWREGLTWAALSGVAAGVARLVARRSAAAGWESALGETPPGVATA